VPESKLYSIAAMARLLDQPESTMHYWKNRFDQLLPSVGQGRHKRFRPEAMDIFRAIGNLLASGLSVADAKAELARRYPLNVTPSSQSAPVDLENGIITPIPRAYDAGGPGTLSGEELAMRIGAAMAEAIGQKLQGYLAQPGAQAGPTSPVGQMAALPTEFVEGLKEELTQARDEIEGLRKQGEDTAAKLKVLEAELIRLRKDGRELEKHLLGKIKAGGGR